MDAESRPVAAPLSSNVAESPYWRRNLYVCLFGSFTTVVAMTLLLPFLPIYVAHLGVQSPAAIVQWSGITFGATFFGAALAAPVWGRLADRYGRKPILMRASLGMAITMSMIGMVQNVWQLALLRLLAGLVGGYSSGSIVLVATETPRTRAAWALGTLSTGVMAGSLAGPLIGGVLPGLIGLRQTFFLAGFTIFLAFLATTFLIREQRQHRPRAGAQRRRGGAWALLPDRRPVIAMLLTALLLMLANMSIEPIITLYVAQFMPGSAHVTLASGLVMSVAALGGILAAPRLGRLADRIGAWKVIIACLAAAALLLVPQAFVTSLWQLLILRFLMGLALAGLLPCIAAQIRHNVPDGATGTILGYSQSAQYAGQVAGPLLGGFIGGQFGMRWVFLATSALMFAGAGYNWLLRRLVGSTR